MKQPRIKIGFTSAAAISVITLLAIVLAALFEYFHVGGSEFSWADLASHEAVITVEVFNDGGTKLPETYELTKGQGVALQSLLLRTHYLRRSSGSIRIKDDSRVCKILIRFPDQNVSYQLFDGINGRYLLGGEHRDWLKILDKDWDTAFQGILAAG